MSKSNTSNKVVAYNGAIVAIAATFAYSLIMMVYTIFRSSLTIWSIMPKGKRTAILLANGFSVAYSVASFSLLMAVFSSVVGVVMAIIMKKSLLRFNPRFNFRKAIIISCITALAMLALLYLLFYALLKEVMTINYAETFLFWYLFPAVIFLVVYIMGGSKLNKVLSKSVIN